jgi:hypothetical protein
MRITITFLLISVLFFSCENKSCQDVVCPAVNSTCVNGDCYCISGYEGEFCTQLSYEKYIGSYTVSEGCTTTTQGFQHNQFQSSINVGVDIDILIINNFAQRGLPVDANIISANYLALTSQNVGSVQLSGGEGNYEPFADRIVLEYNYTAVGTYHQCTATFTPF